MRKRENGKSARLPRVERDGGTASQAKPLPPVDPEMKKAMAECRKIRARSTGRKPVVRLARPRPPRHRGTLWVRRGGHRTPGLGTRAFERRPDPR